jgi:hypothetical protein
MKKQFITEAARMQKLAGIVTEVKILYKDKPFMDYKYPGIETKIKYNNSDIDGIILKLLTGQDSYINNLTVLFPYVSDPESYENRINFNGIEDSELKNLYNKLINIFSKKEYSYSEAKNLLDTVQEQINPEDEYDGVTIEDVLDKIPSNLLSDKVKKFIDTEFEDLWDYFSDIFDPEVLIVKSPNELADYFNFVYDTMVSNDLDIIDIAGYIQNYYNRYLK